MPFEVVKLNPPKRTWAVCTYCGIRARCITCECCGEYAHKSCTQLSRDEQQVPICLGCWEGP